MKVIKKILTYLLILQIPLFLSGCQGWLAPNIGAF